MAEIDDYTVRAVERALQILNSFDEDHPERGVSDIAEAVNLHKATTHRILTTLLKYGFIERTSSGSSYKLGVQLLDLGSRVNRRMNVRREALPFITRLASEIDEAIDLSVFDQNQILCVEMIQSSHALTVAASVGKRLPAHCTAGGKLFLAHFSKEKLDQYFLEPLVGLTQFSITDLPTLKKDFEKIRKNGYAVDEQELELGVRAVAAPIYDANSQMVASVSVPSPISRINEKRIKEIVPILLKTTLEISRRLGYTEQNP